MAKKRRVDDDDREERDDRDDPAKPRSDAYVGLLGITLFVVLVGAVLMFQDHSEIDAEFKKVQPPSLNNLAGDGLEYRAPAK
jgi:hypothetical protein